MEHTADTHGSLGFPPKVFAGRVPPAARIAPEDPHLCVRFKVSSLRGLCLVT